MTKLSGKTVCHQEKVFLRSDSVLRSEVSEWQMFISFCLSLSEFEIIYRKVLVYRVTTDLENPENQDKSGILKETSESQGICLKIQGFATEFQNQGILLSEIHFQPS